MIISRLVLGNWRNFRGADVRLGERTFVLGPSGAGKSNFLDAFRFLRDLATPEGGLQKAVARRGGLASLRSLASTRELDVEIAVELNGTPPWRYSIGITRRPGGQHTPSLRYERLWRDSRLLLERPDADDRRDPVRLARTQLETCAEFDELAQFLESIEDANYGPELLEAIAGTETKTRQARLAKVQEALHSLVPQLRLLASVRDEMAAPHLEAEFEHWRAGAGRLREDRLSEGTLRLIALLWRSLAGEGPLLVEKPERALPAAVVRELPALIHRTPGRQIFICTHSADLLSGGAAGVHEVLLLTPGAEGSKVEPASQLMDVRALLDSGVSLAEAVLPRCGPAAGERWWDSLS